MASSPDHKTGGWREQRPRVELWRGIEHPCGSCKRRGTAVVVSTQVAVMYLCGFCACGLQDGLTRLIDEQQPETKLAMGGPTDAS